MTAIAFETDIPESGWATWSVLGVMGALAAGVLWVSQLSGGAVSGAVPLAQDCAACHAGQAVLASATMGHSEIGLDLVLTPVGDVVHTRQDCASCHAVQ